MRTRGSSGSPSPPWFVPMAGCYRRTVCCIARDNYEPRSCGYQDVPPSSSQSSTCMASGDATVHSPPTSRRRAFPQLGQRRSVASRSGLSPGALIADSTRDPQFGQASCSLSMAEFVIDSQRSTGRVWPLKAATPLLEATFESHDPFGRAAAADNASKAGRLPVPRPSPMTRCGAPLFGRAPTRSRLRLYRGA